MVLGLVTVPRRLVFGVAFTSSSVSTDAPTSLLSSPFSLISFSLIQSFLSLDFVLLHTFGLFPSLCSLPFPGIFSRLPTSLTFTKHSPCTVSSALCLLCQCWLFVSTTLFRPRIHVGRRDVCYLSSHIIFIFCWASKVSPAACHPHCIRSAPGQCEPITLSPWGLCLHLFFGDLFAVRVLTS